MMFAKQRTLPFAVVAKVARGGSPRMASNPVVAGRQILTPPMVVARAPARPGEATSAAPERVGPVGKSFAQKRIHHALEMVGACMMMAAFLAMALFA